MPAKNKKRLRSVDKTFSKCFLNYLPPKNLTVTQWAEQYRILSKETSAEAGPWNSKRTPYLTEIMDSFTDPVIKKITLVASSQVGKSEGELNIIGYIIDQDPSSILYVQPTLDDAKKFSRLRIAPMIRDSETLRKKVADVKTRDSGNTILQKSFAGGMLTIVGSNSASGLASTPVRYVIGDELDRWTLSAGTEGDPWGLAEARTTTFYNAKMIAVSTPTIKGASKIESLYYDGTQETWQRQCPCCDKWHDIKFKNINITKQVISNGSKKDYIIEDIRWTCPDCGYMATEEEMRKQPAKWVAAYPEALKHGHRSFWLNAFSSPWQSWEKIAYEFLKAQKDPQKLKVVYNTMLGELWEDRGDVGDEDSMLARCEDYGLRGDNTPIELPEGVLVLTCGVDTQGDRLEYEVVGHGHYGETWGIKKGILMGDPSYSEVWERLDIVIDHVYRFRNSDRGLKISLTFVDSGGNKTQDVYQECARRINKRVFASKGVGGDGIPYTRLPKKVKIVVKGRTLGNAWLYSLGVDSGKAEIFSNLKVQTPGPKYCHFPKGGDRGYDRTFFNGLLSEKLVLSHTRSRSRWTWVKLPGHERNEALDCRNYALAAFRALDIDLEEVERRLRELDGGEKVSAVKNTQKRTKPKKRMNISDEW